MKEIIEEFKLINLMDKTAVFACFDEGMFTYMVDDDVLIHEISFHAEDTLLDKMKVSDLVNLKRLEYFDHRIFAKEGFGTDSQVLGYKQADLGIRKCWVEYSKDQKQWHINGGEVQFETNGFITVKEFNSLSEANAFINFMS